MQKETTGGTLLILGSILSLVVMAHHPTGHNLAEDFGRMALINRVVHAVAISTLPMILLGLMALRRRLGGTDLSNAALLFFAFTAVSYLIAAVASGFVQTELYSRMAGAEGESLAHYQSLSQLTYFFNQGFAQVGVVAASLCIGLFALAILKTRRMQRGAGLVGIVVSVAVLLALFSGQVTLGVHGFGMIVLSQSIWYVWVGILLLKSTDS